MLRRLTTLAALLGLISACSSRKQPVDLFGDAALPVVSATAPVVVVPPPVDAGPPPATRAESDRAKNWLADIQLLVAKQVTTSPNLASGEGEVTTICDAVTAQRPKTTDPDVIATLDQALALCAFDVPLLVANEALDHLKTSTSQASVRLMCEVSLKEIGKARAVRPKDPKVARAYARRASLNRCH